MTFFMTAVFSSEDKTDFDNSTWSTTSWRSFIVKQQPTYPDPNELEKALEKIRALPGLIPPSQILSLRNQLARAVKGELFLIQAGDCAERFIDCTPEGINTKLEMLLKVGAAMNAELEVGVIRLGRMAGQYGKPRSNDTEIILGGMRQLF